MAQLHAFTGQLPEDRTQLYTEAVQFLNNDWLSLINISEPTRPY